MGYSDYLKSSDWKEKKNQKYSKRKKRCGICASEITVDLHHLNYRELFNVKMEDLRVLCRRCHFLAHDLHKKGKIIFRNDNHLSRFELIKHAVKKELGIGNKNMFR